MQAAGFGGVGVGQDMAGREVLAGEVGYLASCLQVSTYSIGNINKHRNYHQIKPTFYFHERQDSLNELSNEAMNCPMAEDPDCKDFEDLVKRMGMVEQGWCTNALASRFRTALHSKTLFSSNVHMYIQIQCNSWAIFDSRNRDMPPISSDRDRNTDRLK